MLFSASELERESTAIVLYICLTLSQSKKKRKCIREK